MMVSNIVASQGIWISFVSMDANPLAMAFACLPVGFVSLQAEETVQI
jgi:hypothetical protein